MSDAARLGGVLELSWARWIAFVAIALLSSLALEGPLSIAGAEPDFVVILLVYAALRGGALWGAVVGFLLGLFRDALHLVDFGLHALFMTVIGYAIGKLGDTLYLSARAVDVGILLGAKLALGIVVLAAGSNGSWGTFETRFFWEGPLAAIYTALVGGALVRLLSRP